MPNSKRTINLKTVSTTTTSPINISLLDILSIDEIGELIKLVDLVNSRRDTSVSNRFSLPNNSGSLTLNKVETNTDTVMEDNE